MSLDTCTGELENHNKTIQFQNLMFMTSKLLFYLNLTFVDVKDIDECSSGKNPCDETRGECINIPGSFSCSCKDGYTLGPNNTCNSESSFDFFWGSLIMSEHNCMILPMYLIFC